MPHDQPPKAADFFTKEVSEAYDARNSKLSPITDTLHFLIRLALNNLPVQSRILCVGVGTGAEILSLAHEYPDWTFTGIDPSAAMLDVCRARLEEAGVMPRCELRHGYVQDAPEGEHYDAAISLLVGHFLPRDDKTDFYRQMYQRLKPGGYFVNAEISFDLESPEFPAMLQNWARVQSLMGATPQSLQGLPQMLKDTLHVLPPAHIETLMRSAGIALPVRFFQAFMISGWHAQK